MLDIVLRCFVCINTINPLFEEVTIYEVTIMNLILQMKKLRNNNVKYFSQSNVLGKEVEPEFKLSSFDFRVKFLSALPIACSDMKYHNQSFPTKKKKKKNLNGEGFFF